MDRNALDGYENGTETDWWNMLTNKTPYIQKSQSECKREKRIEQLLLLYGLYRSEEPGNQRYI